MKALVIDRIVFCGPACADAALVDVPKGQIVTVSKIIARTIQCYCCGLYLDETAH
jgi:hypothetical protein